MKVTRFDPADTLIIVTAWIHGPRGAKPVSLAFDTAATQTHIIPEILDDIGYGPRDGERVTSITSAIGEEPGYMMRVSKFSALGFAASDFTIDWDQQRATCPEGRTSLSWSPAVDRGHNDVIKIKFSAKDCGACPVRARCTEAKRRSITVRPRDQLRGVARRPVTRSVGRIPVRL